MKRILFFFAVSISLTSYAQQFSFQMYFKDAIGNRDTLTLGYDTAATKLIDAAFGEVNIIGVALDTAFDVRVTDEYEKHQVGGQGTFHTKKQITYYDCDSVTYNRQVIDIWTKHWPVTATWNKTLFTDTCRVWSLFASHLGDVSGPSDLGWEVLLQNDSVTFTRNAWGVNGGPFQYDSMPVFFQMFNDGSIQIGAVHEQDKLNSQVKIFPNPATNSISIDVKKEVAVAFYNVFGQLVLLTEQKENINVVNLPIGLYLIRVADKFGRTQTVKFQKI